MLRVAIDGPGGAGKSTISKIVAEKLNIEYIDTGAMYRAITLKMKRAGISPDDVEAVKRALESTEVDFIGGKIYLDGEDVSNEIRNEEISKNASFYSKLAPVRKKLGDIQKEIAGSKNVLMDGRDIGTNVIPNAELKIFLTADASVRAERRVKQLRETGNEADFNEVLEDIKRRDYQDSTRKLNPLKQAEDAELLDTSHMTIDEVVCTIVNKAKKRIKG